MLGAQSLPRYTATSAETTAPLADSTINDRLDKASLSLIRRIASSLTLAIVVNFLLTCSTLQML